MEASELIQFISKSKKQTPVKLYIKERKPLPFQNCQIFSGTDRIIFGDWSEIQPVLDAHSEDILDLAIENSSRNSAIPMLDLKNINARIEPGAIIREQVKIGDQAIIMMGAVINIGASVGEGTMIDMNAVLGGRATVGKRCHIGAGAVLAGVIEPPSAQPVTVGDHAIIGANAVVLEGVQIGESAVIAAGSVVISDVPPQAVVAGVPARPIKTRDAVAPEKTQVLEALRRL